jgi:hypothetical protein
MTKAGIGVRQAAEAVPRFILVTGHLGDLSSSQWLQIKLDEQEEGLGYHFGGSPEPESHVIQKGIFSRQEKDALPAQKASLQNDESASV